MKTRRRRRYKLISELSWPIRHLIWAVGLKPKNDEHINSFLIRVVEDVASINEDQWNALPQQAQDWYNDAADQLNRARVCVFHTHPRRAPWRWTGRLFGWAVNDYIRERRTLEAPIRKTKKKNKCRGLRS